MSRELHGQDLVEALFNKITHNPGEYSYITEGRSETEILDIINAMHNEFEDNDFFTYADMDDNEVEFGFFGVFVLWEEIFQAWHRDGITIEDKHHILGKYSALDFYPFRLYMSVLNAGGNYEDFTNFHDIAVEHGDYREFCEEHRMHYAEAVNMGTQQEYLHGLAGEAPEGGEA